MLMFNGKKNVCFADSEVDLFYRWKIGYFYLRSFCNSLNLFNKFFYTLWYLCKKILQYFRERKILLLIFKTKLLFLILIPWNWVFSLYSSYFLYTTHPSKFTIWYYRFFRKSYISTLLLLTLIPFRAKSNLLFKMAMKNDIKLALILKMSGGLFDIFDYDFFFLASLFLY